MKPNELTDEQRAKLMACRDSAELRSMLGEMGIVLCISRYSYKKPAGR